MMFKVKILTIGKCKERWLQAAIREYEKRLASYIKFEWLLLKNNQQLLSFSKKEPSYICLEEEGDVLTSKIFSKRFYDILEKERSKISFIIGGDRGISTEIKNNASYIWSLSPLTFTHQISRLILIEQIYRATQIAKGTKYHK